MLRGKLIIVGRDTAFFLIYKKVKNNKREIMSKSKNNDPEILGQEIAQARRVEERWAKKKNKLESPMPKEKYSDFDTGFGIIDPKKIEFDTQLQTVCKEYANSDDEMREKIRDSISMDEFYELLYFSKRASVFAVRENDVEWIVSGLTACTMIEIERIDYRDIYLSISLLYHAAARIEQDADHLFVKLAELSSKEVSGMITNFTKRSSKDLKEFGYDEINTSNGVGFIRWNLRRFEPTYDLKKIALEIAEFIEADKYDPVSITGGVGFPKVWLKTEENEELLFEIIPCMRACITVLGRLRLEEYLNYKEQMFSVSILEMEDDNLAEQLEKFSIEKKPDWYSMVGAASARLFGLVIARSFVQGVESYETEESIQRFKEGLLSILYKYTK